MYFSRVMLVGSTGFALLLLLTLGNSGCEQFQKREPKTVKIGCGHKDITVDIGNGVDLHHLAVYVCPGHTVTWNAPAGVTFTVKFPNGCPFSSCPAIDNNNPTSQPALNPAPVDLMVDKYTITVNGKPFDPHVVGGGRN